MHVVVVEWLSVRETGDDELDKQQGHPTTVFCEISVQRSKYCLEFSIP